jgi:tetratricopeptide (TPR) repeat protein
MTRFIVMQFALLHKCSPMHLRITPLLTTLSFSFAIFCLFLSDYREIAAFSYAQEDSIAVSQASFGPPAIAEHPDILFVESLLNAGFFDLGIEYCRSRQQVATGKDSDAAARWTSLLMQSIVSKNASDASILENPKAMESMLAEVRELANSFDDEPRAMWLKYRYQWCRWFILRRTLAAYLAVPARQALRDWSLETLRNCFDEIELLQLQIQKAPGRSEKNPAKGLPTSSQWISLTNDTLLLQADLFLLRALFYPSKSTERIATATQMLAALDKAATQISESWAGRPNVELARCNALILLDRPADALSELAKLQKRLQQPTDAKLKSSNRWKQRIATLSAEANRNMGNISESNKWLESVGGWTQAPEIAIEYFANLIEAPTGKTTSESQLAQAIQIKSEIGKRFGNYWQQRADAILLSNHLSVSEPASLTREPSESPSSRTPLFKLELLLSEAKQLLAAKQWQKAIEKLNQAETLAANAKDETAALDIAINAAVVLASNKQTEKAQSEFHRAAITYRNSPKAPDAALMSVWNFDWSGNDATSNDSTDSIYRGRLMDVIVTWPNTPQAEKAVVKLDKYLLETEQFPALLDMWSKRIDWLPMERLNQDVAIQRFGTFDNALARFAFVHLLTQEAWFDRSVYGEAEYNQVQASLKELQTKIIAKSAKEWSRTTELVLSEFMVASRWPSADFWPVDRHANDFQMPIGLAWMGGTNGVGFGTPILFGEPCAEVAFIWARAEFVYQQSLRKGIAGRIDPSLIEQLRLSVDRMKSILNRENGVATQGIAERPLAHWKRSIQLYESALQCWSGEEPRGVSTLKSSILADPKNPWWTYRTARLFQTLIGQREQAIQQFRSLASGFAAGSDAWLEFRARTVQTLRQIGNEKAAQELVDLVFATYPTVSNEWKQKFAK